jgi:hypothetical protein
MIGGVGSYTLLLLVSGYLNMCPQHETAAHCLLDVMRYYGHIFDHTCTMVTTDCIVMLPNSQPLDYSCTGYSSRLYVSDPLKPEFNAAANVTRFADIRSCLAAAYDSLIKVYETTEPPLVCSSLLETAVIDSSK